jgi:hypothetical protein
VSPEVLTDLRRCDVRREVLEVHRGMVCVPSSAQPCPGRVDVSAPQSRPALTVDALSCESPGGRVGSKRAGFCPVGRWRS